MNLKEGYSKVRDRTKRLGSEVAATAAVIGAPAVVLGIALHETVLRSDRIIGFRPVGRPYGPQPSRPTKGEVHLPYGTSAIVEFAGKDGGEGSEAFLMDTKDSHEDNPQARRYASAKIIWGRKVTEREVRGRTVYPVEGAVGSVKIETSIVGIPALDAEMTHFRPPKVKPS